MMSVTKYTPEQLERMGIVAREMMGVQPGHSGDWDVYVQDLWDEMADDGSEALYRVVHRVPASLTSDGLIEIKDDQSVVDSEVIEILGVYGSCHDAPRSVGETIEHPYELTYKDCI